jgi:O-antigen ligase
MAFIAGYILVILAVITRKYKAFFIGLLILSIPIDANISIYDIAAPIETISDPNIVITLADFPLLALIIMLIFELIQRRSKTINMPRILIPAILLIIWSSLSVLYAPYPSFSIIQLIDLIRGALIIFVLSNIIFDLKELRLIIMCLCIGLVMQSILGFCQYIVGDMPVLTYLGQAHEVVEQKLGLHSMNRVGGTIGLPNAFACYIVMILPICYSWTDTSVSIRRYLYIITFLLGTIALIMTGSRAGWIAYTISISILGIIALKKDGYFKALLFLVFVLIIIICLSDLIIDRLIKSSSEPIESRIELLKISKSIIKDHPFLGIGLNNFALASSYDRYGILSDVTAPVHNEYLRILNEIGIVGLFFFLWIQVKASLQFWAGSKSKLRYVRSLSIGSLISLTAFSIDIQFGPEYRHTPITNLYWTYLALAGILSLNDNFINRYNDSLRAAER